MNRLQNSDYSPNSDATPNQARRVAGMFAPVRQFSMLFVVIALFSISPTFRSTFFRAEYLPNIFQQSARNIVLAVGMSFVVLTGGIDLSVGSVAALAGVGLGLSMGGSMPPWLAAIAALPLALIPSLLVFRRLPSGPTRLAATAAVFAIALALLGIGLAKGLAGGVHLEIAAAVCVLIGCACGAINGLVVSTGNVPPFVVTLGMMSIARGLTLYATNGESVTALSPRLMALGHGLPLTVITLSVVVAGSVLLARFKTGRYILSIGGNEQATRLSGVDVISYKTLAYVLSGACAATAAIVITAMFGQASTNAASGAELDAIASVVIGGTSLSGGKGSIPGAMAGALTITVITAGLILVHVPDTLQQVVLGAVIVLTVIADQLRSRRSLKVVAAG